MNITHILGLLGGLALFLYGMQMMSGGLEAAAGNKMKKILEKLTSNRFLGVLVGAGITAVIQSSSATTVMVVGFVNSGMMTLKQAIWIIMGANIGTTVTGLLIALDVGALAPLLAFIGVALIVFTKNQKVHHIAQILAGLGILFIGMDMMSSSMNPLRESEAFISLLTNFENPLVGILFGAIFTAIIQSSSASVGILQALAMGGLIGLPSAVYVLFGQNIGTCITAVLASISANRNAKRTTIIHLMFNIFGTILFTVLCMTTPLTSFMQGLVPDNPAMQIANMHTLFNITTTLVLLPFGGLLAKLATKILPEKAAETEGQQKLMYIKSVDIVSEGAVGNSAIAYNDVKRELERMAAMVRYNVDRCFVAVADKNRDELNTIAESEEYVDYLNKEISKYLSHFMAHDSNIGDPVKFSSLFKISGNLERISDHALNICEYTNLLDEKDIAFSENARAEIAKMREVSLAAMDTIMSLDTASVENIAKASAFEQEIDDMTDAFRHNQIERMKSGACSGEACIIYSELLTDFERIGDHILNIVEARA